MIRRVLILLTSAVLFTAGGLNGTASAAAVPLSTATDSAAPIGAAAADADLQAVEAAADQTAAAVAPGGALVNAPRIALPEPAGSSVTASPCTPPATGMSACVTVTPTAATAPALSAVTLPAACSSGSGTLLGWTAVDRRNACAHRAFTLTVQELRNGVPTGVILGTANMHVVDTLEASTASARWSATTVLWVFSATGIGSPQYTNGSLFGNCSGCLGSGGTWTQLADQVTWRGTANIDMSGLAVGESRSGATGFWEYSMGRTGWSNSVIYSQNLPTSRCDNAISNRVPGCVFPNIPATLGFSQSTVPTFVNHVYNAQLSGLPGRLGSGTYLTRLTDGTLIDKNNNKACPATITGYPRPAGYQCDEYPFASTNQGAFTSGAALARSQPGCRMPDPARTGSTGWSRCYIVGTQNGSAGGTAGGFYANQRMMQGDAFQIGYLP